MKFHVVAVDDEQIALEGLALLEWEQHGFELTATFDSAEATTGWLRENSCDLLIADIRMPRTTGLELVAIAKELQPDIVIVLLSGHSEFEYAQDALRQGVFRYLLKPLDDEELGVTLSEVRKMLEERERRRHWTRKIVRDYWFRDHLRLHFDPERHDVFSGEYVSAQTVGPYRIVYAVGDGDLARQHPYSEAVHHSTYLRDREWAWVVRDEDIGVFHGSQPDEVERFGISRVWHDLSDMRSALTEARRAADVWFRYPRQKVYTFVPEPEDSSDRERACFEKAAELADRLSEMHLDDPAGSVRQFLEMVRPEPLSSTTVRRLAYTIGLGLQKMLVRFAGSAVHDGIAELPDPFLVIQEALHLDDLIRDLSDATERAVSYVSHAREQQITDERLSLVLSYLDEHYSEPISLDHVAEVAGMHPSRFSTWFKATQGVNYIDYLTRLRIETAKKRLRRNDALVKEVALASGFQDARYFGQVFKKIVGITPSRYHFLHVRNDA